MNAIRTREQQFWCCPAGPPRAAFEREPIVDGLQLVQVLPPLTCPGEPDEGDRGGGGPEKKNKAPDLQEHQDQDLYRARAGRHCSW